jgi:hypothetical protein
MHYSGKYGIELGEPRFDNSTACVPASQVAYAAMNGGLVVVLLSSYFLLLVVRHESETARSKELQEIGDLVRLELCKAESIGEAKIRVDRNVLKVFCGTSATTTSPYGSHASGAPGSPKTSQIVPAPGSPRTSQGRSSPHPSSHDHSSSGSRQSGHKHVSLSIGDPAALEEVERRMGMSREVGDFSLVSETACPPRRELSPVPDSPLAPSMAQPRTH